MFNYKQWLLDKAQKIVNEEQALVAKQQAELKVLQESQSAQASAMGVAGAVVIKADLTVTPITPATAPTTVPPTPGAA